MGVIQNELIEKFSFRLPVLTIPPTYSALSRAGGVQSFVVIFSQFFLISCVCKPSPLKHMHESTRAALQFSSLRLHAMGTAKLMLINRRPTNRPKRPQKVCRLTQCNCHALSTEAPETDLALAPTPDPVNSASSLPLAHLPISELGDGIFRIHFLKTLTKSGVTDQMFLDKAAVKFAVEGRWQIFCG